MLFYAKSQNGQLVFDNKRLLERYLQSTDTKALVIDIDRETGVRTQNQNSYLWGVVYKCIADSTGYSENELHEIFKRMFLPPRFITWKGQKIRVPGSTAKLDKVQFGEYVDRIASEVGSMGITIPPADKDHEENQ